MEERMHYATLKSKVFTEPATEESRPYVVRYVLLLVVEAKKLSEDHLLGKKGHEIAMDICGALAWQSADEGVEHDGWLNDKSEPILIEILSVASVLDADANHPDDWRRLFDLAARLA